MSKQPPTQELVAKDLLGNEWRFKHIFRGQPRRHLLQSGWSVFVSSKRLIAGDAFIFLRGENGELRVGVRRAMRQQSNSPSSVISSHSMHLGVLATAWHAIQTKSMFTVFYKPRTSPSEFIVPYDQYMESIKKNYTIGMRFKMRFEGDESPEQRFTGSIVGIEDADPKRWPESKWRCLKVRWDETSTILRPERVSPWKLEPALVAPPALNLHPVPRPKRPRTCIVPPSPDSSVLTREGPCKLTADPSSAIGFPRIFHAQETSNLRGAFAESNESESSDKPQLWNPSVDDDIPASRVYSSDKWPAMGQLESSFSGFGSQILASQHEGRCGVTGNNWSTMPPRLSLDLMDSSHYARQDVRYVATGDFSFVPDTRCDQEQSNWLTHSATTDHQKVATQAKELIPKPVFGQPQNARPKEGICKIFGISIANESAPVEAGSLERSNHTQNGTLHQSITFESNQTKGAKTSDNPIMVNELEKQSQSSHPLGGMKESRSCTKVLKQGTALGRSVDLSKFHDYDGLIAELDNLFEFNGELKDRGKNWLVVYTDYEGDMMLVGDDPWEEFVSMVRKYSKILILQKDELQHLNPGYMNSKGDEDHSSGEGVSKEANDLPPPTPDPAL